MGEMATISFRDCKCRTCDPGQAPPRFTGSARVTIFSFAPRATRLAGEAVKSTRSKVQSKNGERWNEENMSGRSSSRRFTAIGTALIFAAVLMVVPLVTAGQKGGQERLLSYRTIEKAEIENLQRWVAAGHEEWCKDARLVAAEELKRITPEFGGDAAELNADAGGDAKRMTFEWASADGRVLYRVTVERFEWLLSIAKDVDGMVWVPTVVEVQLQGADSRSTRDGGRSGAKALSVAAIHAGAEDAS
jgi:hypothetical protein